ncbi:MAG: Smr/MutS family protein [Acidobacteriota bacterium]|nr:Smr/MutS family protein [Acidobacteriota bacterium]
MKASADILEFEALRELLRRYIASPLGKSELDKVQPLADREAVEADLAEAAETMGYLRSAGRPQPAARGAAIRLDFNGLPSLSTTIHKLGIEGAGLEPREIFDVIALLDRAADAKSVLNAVSERFPILGARSRAIGEFRPLLRDLEGKVLPDGSVADHASVALHRLRRDIERQKKSIQESLERFLHANRDEGILQEEFVAIRNDRFVVPIIAGQRRKLNGVIHGASSSGHTLFVEPLETIDLNNELVRLGEEETREVDRILRELTARLGAYAGAIEQALATMSELELVFAKGKFAIDFDCSIPRFSGAPDRKLVLKDARHPLLEDVLRKQSKRIVPIGLNLDSECRTLLISGPNTGGKTVALKTVGLIVLMAQAGLPVPCSEAELPFFEQVLADIGDKQSIQESLSTFSAHISHIRDMALDVTPETLVLLDEIGSATDPEEGGALGVAVVEHFRAAGAFTLASTHLLALKIYGANTTSVLNASMGFDDSTLEPTFRLHLGLPGKSAGLDIAARLGMPEDIMNRARAALSSHELDLARFLSELHTRVDRVDTLEKDLERQRIELAEREKQIRQEWEKRESAKIRELESRCDALLQRFESQAEETMAKLADSAERKAAEHGRRSVAKVKRELREEFETTVLSTQHDSREGQLQARKPQIEEGTRVRLKGIRDLARVRRKLDDDRIEVEAGFMRMQVPLGDVLEIFGAEEQPPGKLPKNVSFQSGPQLTPLFQEVNVIGERAEEALDRVEKFLDSAVMATASRVRIVHGHGMGVLKKAISAFLAKSPHVEKYYPASPHEGGAGATIVELKD